MPKTSWAGGIITALLTITVMALPAAVSAVPVSINSGDPAFPFPQFLPYAHPSGDTLHNLATRAPAGVTHAEMEKTMRDAYQIMMNRAKYVEVRGKTGVGGTKYIHFVDNRNCSEAYGYAMLAAAIMVDKTTFDGLWLHTHDYKMNKVVRYGDGSTAPAYDYSVLPAVYNEAGSDNSAADGDFDIAMALMIAHLQWGDNMGINDSRGNPISYKNDFIKVLKGLTDTLSFSQSNNTTLITGDVGLDGYFKGGDTWGELTEWAFNMQNLVTIGVTKQPYKAKETPQYVDYVAPSYFRQFADYLKKENASTYAWNIFQFERAEASSDWIVGKHIEQDPKNIPFAGAVQINSNNTPVLSSTGVHGEDFRLGWRTVLNYVWHGSPDYTWDPVSHKVTRNKPNTFEKDVGARFARFLWDRRQSPWNKSCEKVIGDGIWWGPSMIKNYYNTQGDEPGTFPLNWVHGSGSPSAVAAQDTNLMAEMYRQCELEWDVETAGDGYLTSTPVYFHGFFRLLGMNILTGNHHAPLNMKRGANMKVYVDVNKTYVFENDTITYTVDYRNYGADSARGVVIINRLNRDFVFVSATGGGSYNSARHFVRWDVGAVPGFKTSSGVNPTKGTVSFKVVIPNANQKRYENRAEIACANGSGWVSNEFPNKISSVMKRNGVDIAKRALRVGHSVYRDTVNPGMNAVYTINFENSAEAGWLNGGRPGVNFSYGHDGTKETDNAHVFMLKAFHDAHEAYIDYGNYRISYFLFDNNYKGIGPGNWDVKYTVGEPAAVESDFQTLNEDITSGEDAKGKWNQRIIVQIADVKDTSRTDTNWATMAAPTPFLITYHGKKGTSIHRGTESPLRAVWTLTANNYAGSRIWGNDWSYNSKAVVKTADGGMANWGYPITPDFTESYDPDYKGKPVTSLHRKLCGTPPSTTVDNILIEEWDGYTWRRVFGNGPVPGREVVNVVIRDTIPQGVTFQNFVTPYPFGIEPKINGRVVTWEIDKLLVGQSGKIQYVVRAETPASFPAVTSARVTSRAWAEADRESPTSAAAVLVITSDSLPPPPPPPTTLYKTANKGIYAPGDTVTYTIAYKNTHGYPVKSAANSEWSGTGASSRVSADGKTIRLNDATDIYHTLSYGTNGFLTGTVQSGAYQDFSIFARSDNSGRRIDINFNDQYDGIHVTITSNSQTPVIIPSPFAYDAGGKTFNYKIEFRRDSLLLWIRDTSALIPSYVQTGIPVQAGYAGVKYTTAGYGDGILTNWASHFDLAYNVVIRDTVPFGVRYINGSAAGQINTGKYAPRQLTAVAANSVITWSKIDTLGANDSLTVTWKGVVDTAKNRVIINTAYTDLSGYPKDSIGAQLRSRFTLDPNVVEPPDTADTATVPPQTGLTVRANPAGGIFSKQLSVTLTSLPGATIYYTTNGTTPDLASPSTIEYDGSPVLLDAGSVGDTVRLRAVAYAGGYEPSEPVTYIYEPLRTVQIQSAVFFDGVGDGLAHGIKFVLSANRSIEPNAAVIRRHLDLIGLPGLPAIDSLRFAGDTVIILLRGAGVDPARSDFRLAVSEPPLPDARYTSEHGYLAARSLTILDGVAPVVTEAVYYPSLSDVGGVHGDTLAVTFNKYAALAQSAGAIIPFALSRAEGPYALELNYIRHDGNTIYFAVSAVAGPNPPEVPAAGDSIRIDVGGGVTNVFGYPQDNPNNRAVALKVRYPELEYVVKTGPSPFVDSLNIWITVEPYLPPVFEALDPKVRIYDRVGGVVASTGKNLKVSVDNGRYSVVWDGCNQKGRKAATGTYLLHVTVNDQNDKRRTIKRLVYLYRD